MCLSTSLNCETPSKDHLGMKMAALLEPNEDSQHAASSKEIVSGVFVPPKATLYRPCDLILVVEDGREFEAHTQVLSKASPFFEKLLKSNMKESNERTVQLEMFSASVMGDALQFMYTGHVQILDEDNARELVILADYLFLPKLKALAGGVLVEKLNISNFLSTYYFLQRYQCENFLFEAKKFILANFNALYSSNQKEVLSMSNEQLQMFISSDEINVSAEKDIFYIILAWVDHDKSKRKQYFAELFRQVRLVYTSLDFIVSEVVSNDLVKDSAECVNLVREALIVIESRRFANLAVTPRTSLQEPVIVACSSFTGQDIKCYSIREDCWYKLDEMRFCLDDSHLVPYGGKIYAVHTATPRQPHAWHGEQAFRYGMESYDPSTRHWMSLPYQDHRDLKQVFLGSDDELYALMSEPCEECHELTQPNEESRPDWAHCSEETHLSFITKYKPQSNSWEDVSSFDHLNLKHDFCIVAKENFIYFIGGAEWHDTGYTYLADVERYDLGKNQWDKAADLQMARSCATGAVAHGKIFIAGGVNQMGKGPKGWRCEAFDERKNQWHFIPRFEIDPRTNPKLLSVDDKLYGLRTTTWFKRSVPHQRQLECYDPDTRTWNREIVIPLDHVSHCCSMRISTEFLHSQMKKDDLTRYFPDYSRDATRPVHYPRGESFFTRHESARERRRERCIIL